MSVRRGLLLIAIAALAAAGLAACGSHPVDPSAALTPGPPPAELMPEARHLVLRG